jgi:aspartate kinase
MDIIVQKFGGTSVGTLESRQLVVEKILAAKKKGHSVVVVVSAIGRKGEPYATDSLIDFVGKVNNDISTRELDLLLSCGEIISSVVLVGMLQAVGYKAISLTGVQAGIITDGCFGSAHIVRVKPDLVTKYLKEDYIVVVAGFQGVSEDGEITTLGRGGSDTTAAALGVALNASVVEIYTDVNGLKTADPRIVSNPKTIDRVTYNEICQLAYEGARVIHPRAVEIAMQGNVPIKIKCTFTDEPGTLVTNSVQPYEETTIKGDRLITGVTQIVGITQVCVDTTGLDDHCFNMNFMSKLAEEHISIDFINVSPDRTVFTVPDGTGDKVLEIVKQFNVDAVLRRGCAKVAVVGAGMTGVPGVMARIVKALTLQNIQILQSADSYTTIWCLVDNRDMCAAVAALHQEFGLGE